MFKEYYDIIYRDSDISLSLLQDNNVIEKIKEFGHLQTGWDFGYGYAPSKEVIKKSIGVYQYGELLGFNGDARPLTEGGIIVNLFNEDDFIYLSIKNDGLIDLTYEKGIGANYEIMGDIENVSFETISKTLTTLKKQWFSSELYTSPSMMSTADASQVTVSNDMEMEYQYF